VGLELLASTVEMMFGPDIVPMPAPWLLKLRSPDKSESPAVVCRQLSLMRLHRMKSRNSATSPGLDGLVHTLAAAAQRHAGAEQHEGAAGEAQATHSPRVHLQGFMEGSLRCSGCRTAVMVRP